MYVPDVCVRFRNGMEKEETFILCTLFGTDRKEGSCSSVVLAS